MALPLAAMGQMGQNAAKRPDERGKPLREEPNPLRVTWTLTIATALSLFGDATMYAVLPSHYAVLGITTIQVGWLLSVNRLVRVPLNMISGWLSDRLGPKLPYIVGLTLGVLSTVGYGLGKGFWPLLGFRAMWGVAWTLIVVAAYGMILDVSTGRTRGRLSGTYASFSFFGGSLGQLLGAMLVDSLGFSSGMVILGGCTLLGCGAALSLPRTRNRTVKAARCFETETPRPAARVRWVIRGIWQGDVRLRVIGVLNFAHRFFFAGVLYATFGHYLLRSIGQSLRLGSLSIGVASLTAILLFVRNVVTVLVGPGLGHLSDRLGDRTRVLLLGEVLGVVGLACFAVEGPGWLVAPGVLFAAMAYGVVPPLLVAWMGDLTAREGRGPIVGAYQTMGDLGSGLAPLIAYPLLAAIGLRSVYALSAGLLALTVPLILATMRQKPKATGGTAQR